MWLGLVGSVSAAPSLPAGGEVELVLVVHDTHLEEGEALSVDLRLANRSGKTVTVARPVDGSFDGIRSPQWSFEYLDPKGTLVAEVLGHGPGRDCGMFNALAPQDLRTLRPGAETTLAGQALEWMPPQRVLPSARPGTWRVRAHYRSDGADGLTALDLVSAPVEIVVSGGDEALWQCRTDQLASRRDHEAVSGSIVAALPRGEGYRLVLQRHEQTVRAGEHHSRGRVWIQDTDGQLNSQGEAFTLLEVDNPGFATAISVPGGLLLAHTPGEVGGRRVELLSWQEGYRPSAPLVVSPAPGNPYVVALTRDKDNVVLAFEGPEASGGALQVQPLTLTGQRRGPVLTLAETFLGTPLLAADADLMVLGYELAEPRRFRTITLSVEGRAQGAALDWPIDGTVMSLGTPGDNLEVVFADSGYRGDDPQDLMGLYRQRGPGGTPVALTPLDRQTARFGTGAWASGPLGWAWSAKNELYASIGGGNRLVSRTAEGTPQMLGVSGRFLLAWSDHRDDRSAACLQLGECATEGYLAIYDAHGEELVGPTRLTHDARPAPVAPYDDWERFCAR